MQSLFLQIKRAPILLVAILATGFLAHAIFASAETLDDRVQQIQEKIDDKRDGIAELDKQIQELRNKLTLTAQEKKTLQNKIKEIDLLRKNLALQSQITQVKASRTRDAVAALNRSIKEKQAIIQRTREQIATAMIAMQQEERRSSLEMFLSATSLSDAVDGVNRLEQIQDSLNAAVKNLKEETSELSGDKKEQETKVHDLDQLNKEIIAQKQVAEEQKAEQEQLVKQTKNKESEYQKLLAENLRRKTEFERELEQFQDDLRQEVDKTSFPKPGTRVFINPVGGRITQHFGYNEFAKKAYAGGRHNGTDFGVPTGTSVKAAAGGTIWAVGDTDASCRGASYGKYVLVKHPNGISTLYAHLSRPMVSMGQEVERGDVIALSGNTGYSTGPHVHVTAFVTSATKVGDIPSKACPGAVFKMPVAPKEAYLNFEDYI